MLHSPDTTADESPPSRESSALRIASGSETDGAADTPALSRSIGHWIVVAMLAAIGIGYAFSTMFSSFSNYDDEGYIALSVKQFLSGKVLYDEVFTQYGPFFFLVCKLFHRMTGLEVSHDVIRLRGVAYWVLSSGLCSAFAWRMTRSHLLATVTFLTTLTHLKALSQEPGHPQDLSIFLLAIVVFLSTYAVPRRKVGFCLVAGAVAAGLLFTKINLGIYLMEAMVLVIVAGLGDRPGVLALRGFGVAAILLLPLLLMRAQLGTAWGLGLCLLMTLAPVPMLAFTFRGKGQPSSRVGDLIALLAATAACSVAILLTAWMLGTSAKGLYHGILGQHVRFSNTFWIPLPSGWKQLAWLIVATLAGLACARPAIRRNPLVRRLLHVVMFVYALAVFAAAWRSISGALLLQFAFPFSWLILIHGDEQDDEADRRMPRPFARLVLLAVVIFEALQVFPVAGAQVNMATFLLVPLAAVCLGDVFRAMAAIVPLDGPIFRLAPALDRRILRYVPAVVTAGLLLIGSRITSRQIKYYRSQTPLGLYGSSLVRLSTSEVANYRDLVARLRGADTFVTMPGLNSLYLWTRMDPPTSLNATTWMTQFSDDQQRQVVAALAGYSRVYAVWNPVITNFWLRGQPIDDKPLVSYIRNCELVENVGEYKILMRVGSPEIGSGKSPDGAGADATGGPAERSGGPAVGQAVRIETSGLGRP